MSDSVTPLLIGVDGGGTRCRFGLVVSGARFETIGPAANASTDLAGAISSVQAGIADLAKQSGVSMSDLSAARAFVGLAGVLGGPQISAIAAILPTQNAWITDDRRAAVAGALAQDDGLIAGIGTGSFLARQSAGHVTYLGGWGARLGDEASGAWLGRNALARVLHGIDGVEALSDLTRDLLAQFGGDTTGIVEFAARATPQEYAHYARLVADAADAGDAQGMALMRAGAEYIARACAALGGRDDTPLCLLGGVAPRYRSYLGGDLAKRVADPKGSALDGALALAAQVPIG